MAKPEGYLGGVHDSPILVEIEVKRQNQLEEHLERIKFRQKWLNMDLQILVNQYQYDEADDPKSPCIPSK